MDWISLKIPVYACHDPRMKGSGSDGSKEARRKKTGQVRSYYFLILIMQPKKSNNSFGCMNEY